jgi:hypothetical protein
MPEFVPPSRRLCGKMGGFQPIGFGIEARNKSREQPVVPHNPYAAGRGPKAAISTVGQT